MLAAATVCASPHTAVAVPAASTALSRTGLALYLGEGVLFVLRRGIVCLLWQVEVCGCGDRGDPPIGSPPIAHRPPP
jgi:hypothetical protein